MHHRILSPCSYYDLRVSTINQCTLYLNKHSPHLYNIMLFTPLLPNPPDPVLGVYSNHLGFKPSVCHVDGVVFGPGISDDGTCGDARTALRDTVVVDTDTAHLDSLHSGS